MKGNIKKGLILMGATAVVVASAGAQTLKNYEQGDPEKPEYDYLKEYAPLKNYINHSKYPNFRLGIGTTVNDYLTNPTVEGLTNDNFTETVAGNTMKMSSCVNNSGSMDFSKVKEYVEAADKAGLNVYGHTLAWHSQQPNGWLRSLIKDKPAEPFENPDTIVCISVGEKDFRKQQSVGWASDKEKYGYSLTFSSADGLKIHTTGCDNFWDVQFIAYDNIPVEAGKIYRFTFEIKGSEAGTLHTKLGDWSNGGYTNFDFTTDWQEMALDYESPVDSPFLLLQCGDFTGDINIRGIKVEETVGAMRDGDALIFPQSVPRTREEKREILTGAMEQWISGMMEACGGKVKAWDVVNEAIAGSGNDGNGFYTLQHSDGFNGDATWDVGGDSFYWQDHMGDLEYVRTAVRLARQYGPEDIKLFINDYNLESDWDSCKKLRSLINWIKRWEEDGETFIDGIGTQMHISYYENISTQESKKSYISYMFQLMAKTGKLVRISEMDMGYVNLNGTNVATVQMTEKQHKNMADYYKWIIKEYLRIIPPEQQWGICFWCPTDSPAGSSWRANCPVGIWTDGTFYRKHVYDGIVKGLGGVDWSGVEEVADDESVENQTESGVFNLNGVRICEADEFSELPSGVYIHDRKVIMK